jgi:transketolase
VALSRETGPSLLALSRQSMAELPGCKADGVMKGAYIVDDSDGAPSHILMASGSELPLCTEAAKTLREEGHNVRVVSVPCMELWEEQSDEYKESVLPKACRKRVSVEALSTLGWREFVTDDGIMLGMHSFGASAPGDVMMEKFGFTPEKVVEAAKKL